MNITDRALARVMAIARGDMPATKSGIFFDQVTDLLGSAGRVTPQSAGSIWVHVRTPADFHYVQELLALAATAEVLDPCLALPVTSRRLWVIRYPAIYWRSALRLGMLLFLPLLTLFVSLHTDLGKTHRVIANQLVASLLVAVLWLHHRRQTRTFRAIVQEGKNRAGIDREQLASADDRQRHSEMIRELLREGEYQFRHAVDPTIVVTHLAGLIRRLIPDADGAAVWLLSASGTNLEVRHAEGRCLNLYVEAPSRPKSAGACGLALRTRRSYMVVNAQVDQVYDPPDAFLFGSALALPLVTAQSEIGAVGIVRSVEGAIADDLVWPAEVLCGLAALRLEALQAQYRERELLQRFAEMVSLGDPKDQTQGEEPVKRLAAYLADAAGADAYVTLTIQEDGLFGVGPASGVEPELLTYVSSFGQQQPEPYRHGARVTEMSAADLAASRHANIAEQYGITRLIQVPVTSLDGTRRAHVVLVFRDGSTRPSWLNGVPIWESYARYVGVALHNMDLYRTVVEQSGQLRELHAHQVQAQEAERRRIALELHDWVVQGLAAPSYRMQVADQILDRDPAGAHAEIAAAVDQLHRAGEDLRRIMKGLRPYLLDELGLYKAIESYAAEWSVSSGIGCTVFSDDDAVLPSGADQALAAYRIVQEALNNVAKHAGASQVNISLTRSGNAACIRVIDNGRGLSDGVRDKRSLGMLGMEERATSVGGQVTVADRPGGGCIVTCCIPLSH